MRITYKKLINLPVETEDGLLLGRVIDLEIDIENFNVLNFFVKSQHLLKGLFEKELIINYKEIIQITEKKIIVSNNLIKTITEKQARNIKTAEQKAAVNTCKSKG